MIWLIPEIIGQIAIAVLIGDALLYAIFGREFTKEFKASSRWMRLKVFLILYPILFAIPFLWLNKKWKETA
jgi:hypothetical protein